MERWTSWMGTLKTVKIWKLGGDGLRVQEGSLPTGRKLVQGRRCCDLTQEAARMLGTASKREESAKRYTS